MSVKLLTEHHLEFQSLKGGWTGSSESTLVKMPHCWKSHIRNFYWCWASNRREKYFTNFSGIALLFCLAVRVLRLIVYAT